MFTGEKECFDCKEIFEWYHQDIRTDRIIDERKYRVFKIPKEKMKAISFTKLKKNKYEVGVHCRNCDYLNTFEFESENIL